MASVTSGPSSARIRLRASKNCEKRLRVDPQGLELCDVGCGERGLVFRVLQALQSQEAGALIRPDTLSASGVTDVGLRVLCFRIHGITEDSQPRGGPTQTCTKAE